MAQARGTVALRQNQEEDAQKEGRGDDQEHERATLDGCPLRSRERKRRRQERALEARRYFHSDFPSSGSCSCSEHEIAR